MKRRQATFFVLLLLSFSCRSQAPVELRSTDPNTRETAATGTAGMVSSAHPLATQAGLKILRQGGNAFDAAVAVAAMLNVVEPNMSGIGGYGTILIYDAEKQQVRFLNASGRIPEAVDSDVYRAPTPGYLDNRRGAKAVSTPGNARAWEALWDTYGVQPWHTLFDPAIRTAESGFVLSDGLAASISNAFDRFSAPTRTIYGVDERPLSEGDTLVQRDLAQTLRSIAAQGADAVYTGEIGQAIDRTMREAGGFLSISDLDQMEAEWYDPIVIDYRGYRVYTASPPATAFPSLIRLGLMSRLDVAALGHNTPTYLHRFAEVTKHAFWCRLAYAGDPDITPPPLDRLLSETYWTEQAGDINLDQAAPFVPPTTVSENGKNTTHFVVADRWGNIVSATQTLGNSFGSRILVEGTGIWLNNSLAYCTFEPKGNPMDAHAGHHKLSGDCPTIILQDDKPWAALGTPGGHTIGQTVPQMVMNLVDFDMDIQQALGAPRISFIEPDRLAVETSIEESIRDVLEALGHNVSTVRALGKAHGLTITYSPDGTPEYFAGGADPRGSGTAQGLVFFE